MNLSVTGRDELEGNPSMRTWNVEKEEERRKLGRCKVKKDLEQLVKEFGGIGHDDRYVTYIVVGKKT